MNETVSIVERSIHVLSSHKNGGKNAARTHPEVRWPSLCTAIPGCRYYTRALDRPLSHETVKSVQLRAGSALRARSIHWFNHLLKRCTRLTIRCVSRFVFNSCAAFLWKSPRIALDKSVSWLCAKVRDCVIPWKHGRDTTMLSIDESRWKHHQRFFPLIVERVTKKKKKEKVRRNEKRKGKRSNWKDDCTKFHVTRKRILIVRSEFQSPKMVVDGEKSVSS